MPDAPISAAAYVRISKDREGRELGVQRQEEDCRALAARLGWHVHAVYSDNDISASSKSRKPRPGYIQMLSEVDNGTVTGIVAYSTSRLTRRPMEFEGLVSRAEAGLQIATVAAGEVDLQTATGRMIARFLAARDAMEAEENSERSRRERQQRREQGRWHGGNRPFGFEPDGTTPRPAEQALILQACRDILQGRSLMGIARHWTTELGVTPQGNAVFNPTTVHDILTRERLVGRLPSGHRANWQPVIDEATWQGVRAVLADPTRMRPRGESRLLTGIALCGVCGEGSSIHGSVDRYGRGGYRCRGNRHLERQAAPVDEYVTRIVTQYLAGMRVTQEQPRDDAAPLAAQAEGLRRRQREINREYAKGDMPFSQLAEITAVIRDDLDQVEARMVAATAVSALTGLPATVEEIRSAWPGFDVERRRGLVRASGLRIVVHPAGRGKWHFDPDTVRVSPAGIAES